MDETTPNPPSEPSLLARIVQAQTRISAAGYDLDNVMNQIVRQAQEITGADGAAVELVDGHEMVYRAVSGIASASLGLRISANASLSGLCVRLSKALISDDCEQDTRVDLQACQHVGLRSMVVVPLLYKTEVVGVLKVMARRTRRFGLSSIALLMLLSELIAAALFKALHYQDHELRELANHDELTGLASRRFFHEQLQQAILDARDSHQSFALLFADLDGLTAINDQFGHHVGDAAIREFGHRLQQTVRVIDTVARLGSDEFAVLLMGGVSPQQVQATITQLTHNLAQPLLADGHSIPLVASVGSALFPQDAQEALALIEVADLAMTQMKQQRHAS